MVHMSRVIGVRVRSRLPVVVQDGPRALGVDCRDLRHHLAIIVVRVVIVLARSGLLLRRTDLLRARSLGAVAVVPVLALVRFVRRVSALRCLIALVTVLLLIMHSTPPEHVGKSSDTVPVAGVEPVPPELSQFPVSHLLGLFNLLRIELNLRGINCIRATVSLCISFVRWLEVAIVIVILGWLGRSLASCLSILLGNPALELVDGALLELLAHLLLLAEPGVLGLASLIHVSSVVLRVWGLRVPLRALRRVRLLRVRSCHIEHHIIQLLVGLSWRINVWRLRLSRASSAAATALWLLSLDIDVLIILQRHVFLDEIGHCLA